MDVQAAKGQEILEDLIKMDEGACRLGEVALVPYHSPISLTNQIFYETLFDENAACHLALGDSYPTCLEKGPERSEEETEKSRAQRFHDHVDFMVGGPDLTITGIRKDGTRVPCSWTGIGRKRGCEKMIFTSPSLVSSH